MVIFQVTIPASGKVQLSAGLPSYAPPNIFVQYLTIQNNAGHSIRIGDTTVSATKGILLASGTPGGSLGINGFMSYGSYVSDWWVFGTPADVIDVMYIS